MLGDYLLAFNMHQVESKYFYFTTTVAAQFGQEGTTHKHLFSYNDDDADA